MRLTMTALTISTLAGCFGMMATPGSSTPATTGTAPMPMTNDQALAYAQAHRDPNMGVLTAVNKLAVPICRIVLLSVENRSSTVIQAGAHDPHHGDLDPRDEPLLEPGQDSLVTFDKQPAANSMAVTAFGCDRTDKHLGKYVVDENKVLFEQTVAIADQGKLVIAR